MQITPEQLEKARRRERSFAERNNSRNKILKRIYGVCIALIAVGIGVMFAVLPLGIGISAAAAAVFAFIFAMQQAADRKNMLSCYHYMTTPELDGILEKYYSEYCSDEVVEQANAALIKEKDSRRRGILRAVISNASFARGEFDSGYRSLFKDEELFEEDEFFALLYYKGVTEYYLSINSTTGGTEYGEQAYRDFCRIFEKSKRLKNNYAAVKTAVQCEIYYTFAHGDRPACIAYVDMLTGNKGDDMPTREDAMLMVVKAECLKFMGRSAESSAIAQEVHPLFEGTPYMDTRIKRLI